MSLAPTIFSENDPIPMECDTSYDPTVELIKYIIQASYLLLNVILNLMVLRVFVFSKNHKFRDSSFFMIYAADLIIGVYMSLSEIVVGRLFIYITALCPILSTYFYEPSLFLKIFFTLTHYSQGFKTVSQVFLSFNRMTSVVFPVSYYKSWKTIQKPSLILLFVMPFGVIWNVILSRVYINPSSGGFSVNYIRKISWARLSKFHLVYFAISLVLIVIFSGVTLYGLFVMKTRLKKAEISITLSTMVISVEFSLLAVFQELGHKDHSVSVNLENPSASPVTTDFVNESSGMSSTKFSLPANFSYYDPLPFNCTENTNIPVSLAMYGIQASYLILGAALNFLIVYTIFMSKGSSYRHNSFYILYAADAVMGIYINLTEVLFGRLFIYITPLCPIVSPFFFTPSIITKFYYTAVHYSLGFKTFSQIFMSFNRMTCVVFPMKHQKLWRQILYPVLVILFVLPLAVIWNILISRVYINPNGAGFSTNYKEAIPWASISLFHLIHCAISFVLVIIFFFITIFGLATLKQRIKSAERSLTIVTMIMSVQTMIFAFIQIYFAFLAVYTPNIRGVLLLAVSFVFDSMNVFGPIALIVMSRQLRRDVFHLKNDETQPVSRSISTTSHHQPLSRAVSTVVVPITS